MSDMLLDKGLLPSRLGGDGGHQGFFNVNDHAKVDKEVGERLKEWFSQDVDEKLSMFGKHAYFAISALGGNPDVLELQSASKYLAEGLHDVRYWAVCERDRCRRARPPLPDDARRRPRK